jgi:tRNA-2-methylthio-N6-dimethylallyladenosine synthase
METEEDHEKTLRLIEDCAFDSAYIFKFSPRSGTEAVKLPGAVPEDVAQRRFLEVLRTVEQNAFRSNRRKISSTEEIYIRHGQTGDGRAVGETWSGHAVHVPTGVEPGRYITARIESAGPHVLYANEPRGEPH